MSIVSTLKCCLLSWTDDRRQFITLNGHLGLQHDRRDSARRAGSSATAETCSATISTAGVWVLTVRLVQDKVF